MSAFSKSLAAGLLAAALAGCTTPPAQYAATLPQQDPKWASPECAEFRAAAASYEATEKKPMNMALGIALGPYGLGLAAASREGREKQRKIFKREMHLACSSRPLPAELNFDPRALMAGG